MDKFADYILSEENGLRAVGVSKALGASTANTLTFTYDAEQSMVRLWKRRYVIPSP